MSKKKINLRGLKDTNDPFYRYKMVPISVVKQKTKSVITNIAEVSKDISRDPQMMIEYFKKKFGMNIVYDKKTDKAEVKNISQDELQNAIFEFIDYFVLCPTCTNPETVLSIDNGSIHIKCKACTHYDKINVTGKVALKTLDSIMKLC